MFFKNLTFYLAFLLVVSGFFFENHAQNSTARFLLWQPSARSNAMGGTGTAFHDNAYAAYYNPAILAFSPDINLVGSVVKPVPTFGNIVHSFFAGNVNLKGFGALGLSANLFWMGNQYFTHISSVDSKSFNWQAKISYARKVKQHFAFGASLSILKYNLSDFKISVGGSRGDGLTSTVLADFGLMACNILPSLTISNSGIKIKPILRKWADVKDRKGISIGLSLLNYGSKIVFVNEELKDNPPTLLSLGTNYWILNDQGLSVLLAIDFEKQVHESSTLDYIHFGGEIDFFHMFAFRSGYYLDTFGPKTSFFTIGMGFHTRYFSFNLARYKRTLLPSWQFDGTISLEI
jgi:hypothetical protein